MPGAATFFYSLVFCRILGAVRIRRFTRTERRQAPDQGTRERMPVLSFPALEGRGLPRTWVKRRARPRLAGHLLRRAAMGHVFAILITSARSKRLACVFTLFAPSEPP